MLKGVFEGTTIQALVLKVGVAFPDGRGERIACREH